jgi:glycosyltransferase involved in cell wall biosynthesis
MPMMWEETFSLLTREAFLAGLPVVAARRGALPEAIQDGVNGLLFEPENATDLQRCLRRLITEPTLLERLRKAECQVRTLEEYVQETESIYTELIRSVPAAKK